MLGKQGSVLLGTNPISVSRLERLPMKIPMRVRLKLYGVFRSAANASSLTIEIPDKDVTVKSAIQRLVSQAEFGGLKSLLMDSTTSDPRPNALIMVSGREISALRGLDTVLAEDDELELLPVAHGG